MSTTPLLSLVALLTVTLVPHPASGQAVAIGPRSEDPIATAVANAAKGAQVTEAPATLVYSNRAIVRFRATVLTRTPSARAAAAVDLLDRLVDELPSGRVTTQAYDDGIVVRIDTRPVFVIFSADVDPLAGEQLAAKAAEAAMRLQRAIDEAIELRTPGRLVKAGARALAATAILLTALWLVIWIDRRIAARVSRTAERQLARLAGGEALAHLTDTRTHVQRAFALVSVVLGAFLTYWWATTVLRSFPYTRPWGESLRGGLLSIAGSAGRGFVDALPNLFTVMLIVVLTRCVARLARLVFTAVEQGRITLPGVYPDTAQPTRRIVVALVWLLCLIGAYPYLPGSQSEVFKGISVFVGLIVSLGSTGMMNQVMGGFMVTYSRALKCGEYVRVANVEGTVTALGALSTKIKTPRNEEVTIPNAVVASQATTNYSRHHADGVYASTSVTIGYDTPWRQVRALLLGAAERTAGVRRRPTPVVLQTALHDFYVEYMLFVALEDPHHRFLILDALHAHIQDAFNEYGVQIMSPRYVGDPIGAKIVPPSRWYASPSPPPADFAPTGTFAAEREPTHGA